MHLPPLPSILPHDQLTMVYQTPHLLSPPQTPQPSNLHKTINLILQPSYLTISSMEDLSNHHLHRLVAISLSDGSRLVLKISPPSATLLLRQEHHLLTSEAAALATLAKSSLPVPQVLKYERGSTHLGRPFLLTSRLPGIKYSEVLPYLTHSDKATIEMQLRSLRSCISQHSSSTFGPAGLVATAKEGGGYKTWREAFIAMLESVMQDGEDMMVNISYFQIREAVSRWESYLDEVTEARLLVLGLGKPENVLIERRTNEVTGLLDFGMAVWGDPAMGVGGGKTDIRSLL